MTCIMNRWARIESNIPVIRLDERRTRQPNVDQANKVREIEANALDGINV